jgi:hypothetical protein
VHWPRVVRFLQSLPPYALIGREGREGGGEGGREGKLDGGYWPSGPLSAVFAALCFDWYPSLPPSLPPSPTWDAVTGSTCS